MRRVSYCEFGNSDESNGHVRKTSIADAHSSTSFTMSFFFSGCVQPLHGCWYAIISDQTKKRPGSYMCLCIFVHSKVCTAHLIASLTSLSCVHVHLRFCSSQWWDRLIGSILNLESQRCDCHLIVICSKLASALVSFLQLIMYCPTQAVHVAYQGTAGVVIVYDIESRPAVEDIFFTLCSNIRCWFKVLVLTRNIQRVCIAVIAALTHTIQ